MPVSGLPGGVVTLEHTQGHFPRTRKRPGPGRPEEATEVKQAKKRKRLEKAIADGTISIADLANCTTSEINKVTKEGKDKTAVDH